MSHRLELPVRFLMSPFVPVASILSGRSEQVRPEEFALRRQVPLWLLVASYFFCVPGLYLAVLYLPAQSLRLPVAPRESHEWRSRLIFPRLILLVGVAAAAGFLIHGLSGGALAGLDFACFSLSLYAGMGLAGVLHLKLAADQVTLHLNAAGDGVVVVFPDRLDAVYAAYARALEQYRQDPQASGLPAWPGLNPPAEEDYAETVKAGWDTQAAPPAGGEDDLQPPPPDLSA